MRAHRRRAARSWRLALPKAFVGGLGACVLASAECAHAAECDAAYCTRPSAMKIASAVRHQPRLEFGDRSSTQKTDAAMMADERNIAPFALAALRWYLRHAYQPLAMHLSMSW